jgi:glutamine cyclotransferase
MIVALILLLGSVLCRKFSNVEGKLDVLSSVDIAETVCMEGLFVYDGYLYQSNGWYGESALVKVSTDTGSVVKRFNLKKQYFAEGIAIVDSLIYQLTYTHQTCFVYREKQNEFELVGNHSYASKEGWGKWGFLNRKPSSTTPFH